jgi:hypothetical protein
MVVATASITAMALPAESFPVTMRRMGEGTVISWFS